MNTEQDASAPMAAEPQTASTAVEMRPSSVSPLADLPVELFYRVARPLSTVDFCALRLTCRAVEQRLFQTFSREFFSRKQFMMSGPSLQALVDIAHHPHLSTKLEHVTIGLEYLGTSALLPRNSNDMAEYAREYRLGQEALHDQNTLFSSGRAVEMLADAFAHLPNLKTVSIRDAPSRSRFRDFNSGLRYWNSYGYPTLHRKFDIRFYAVSFEQRCAFSTNVFSSLTAALARSGARPENLEMIMREKSRGISDSGFYIPPTDAERARHKAMLSGLRKLHLFIALDGSRSKFDENPFGRAQSTDARVQGVTNAAVAHFDASHYIAHTAPNLEWLRLNFDDPTQRLLPHRVVAEALLMYWACGGPKVAGAEQKEQTIAYPKLRRLDLGFANVSPKALWTVLKSLPVLEEISLHKCTLSWEGKPELLLPDGVQADEGLQNPSTMIWQAFLLWLPRVAPNLKHVEISGPLEQTDRGLAPLVLDTGNYNFAIHVEADENLADECAKAAAQLSCKPVLLSDSSVNDTDFGFSDDPENELLENDDDDDDSSDNQGEDSDVMEV